MPPAILAGNLGKRSLRGISSSKLTFHSLYFSSFFFLFFFLFHIERDKTIWKINCTGLRVTCVRARLCTGSLLDFTVVAFILGTEAATYFNIPAYFVKLEVWAEELRESLSSTEIPWTWRAELSDRLKKKKKQKT